jgi:hypothetical protein
MSADAGDLHRTGILGADFDPGSSGCRATIRPT